MSSKIEVKRICQVCSKEFIAKKTTTRCCSIECNRKAYKKNIKDFKIEKSNKETSELKFKPLEDLKAREFLTVSQVSKLIGCSRQNVYKLINTGKLKATNILIKKTIIKRACMIGKKSCNIDFYFIILEGVGVIEFLYTYRRVKICFIL